MSVVLTVLIWASADSLVSETVSIHVSFEPVPAVGAGEMLVEAEHPNVAHELQVSGPRKLAEKIRNAAPRRIRIPVSQHPTGTARIALDRNLVKRLLADQWSDFGKLAVVSVRPDSLSVIVDHWTTKEVALVLPQRTLTYDVEPQIQPSTVSVRMRETALARLPTGRAGLLDGKAGSLVGEQLQIDISAKVERLLKDQPPGRSVTVPVALDARVFGLDAKLDPGTISVTATVKAERTTAQISAVPILIAVSFPNLEKSYRPVKPDGTALTLVAPPIQVAGPTDAVARLQQGTTRAYGIIHLKQENLEELNTLLLMIPEYYLPPGIELAKEPEPVQFILKDVSGIDDEN